MLRGENHRHCHHHLSFSISDEMELKPGLLALVTGGASRIDCNGSDVTMKIMTFSQQGSRAICILSANGTISNVTLRQPSTSGGTFNIRGTAFCPLRGRFEILSLSGSYMPTENEGTKSRSGGISVSLAGSDGRVVGLAGLLIAAGPV
ncbi:AT-hook motif nuclear-localized protein 7-like [Rosa sericea]